jgi:hypothetical protein
MDNLEEDAMLAELTDQIDNKLLEWSMQHKIPPLNLTAVVLARLTWLAKMGNYREDFVELLKAPGNIINEEPEEKVVH